MSTAPHASSRRPSASCCDSRRDAVVSQTSSVAVARDVARLASTRAPRSVDRGVCCSLSRSANCGVAPARRAMSTVTPSTSPITGLPQADERRCNASAQTAARLLLLWRGRGRQVRQRRQVRRRQVLRECHVSKKAAGLLLLWRGRGRQVRQRRQVRRRSPDHPSPRRRQHQQHHQRGGQVRWRRVRRRQVPRRRVWWRQVRRRHVRPGRRHSAPW